MKPSKISVRVKKNHNMSGLKEYRIWVGMRQRCNDPKSEYYYLYGGRAISVCKTWDSFEVFYADMGRRPSDKYSIDRINGEMGYSKENCRWATVSTQMRNRRGFSNLGVRYFHKSKGNYEGAPDRYHIKVPPFKKTSSMHLEKALAILTIRISSKEHRGYLEAV